MSHIHSPSRARERTLLWLLHLILEAEELGSPPWQPVCQHSVLPRRAQLQRVSAVAGTLMNWLAVAPAAKDTDVQDELKALLHKAGDNATDMSLYQRVFFLSFDQ